MKRGSIDSAVRVPDRGSARAAGWVFVHRDYHARNLMVVKERNPGIIDFQDALRGPVGLRPGVAAEGLLRPPGRARAAWVGLGE